MRREDAEMLGISALTHIAGDQERLERFLAVTGLDPAQLRSEAGKPGFATGVLDYLCSDEALLIGFAAEQGLSPEAVAGAWKLLAGPAAEW
ncbi:MAG: DUF3572 domain-containing protein [Beijerinckiaceae bacterium]|nr:DUF3572 domain-containing protein [Beijerinckiaceae bacterium]